MDPKWSQIQSCIKLIGHRVAENLLHTYWNISEQHNRHHWESRAGVLWTEVTATPRVMSSILQSKSSFPACVAFASNYAADSLIQYSISPPYAYYCSFLSTVGVWDCWSWSCWASLYNYAEHAESGGVVMSLIVKFDCSIPGFREDTTIIHTKWCRPQFHVKLLDVAQTNCRVEPVRDKLLYIWIGQEQLGMTE